MKKIVEKNLLQIPLYHGTTTLFIDSIKAHGLGGRNLIEEWDLVSIYLRLFETADNLFFDADFWQEIREKASLIAYQTNSSDGLNYNFKHGSAYLTPFKDIAIDYAGIEEGSELLGYIKGLALFLISKRESEAVNKILPMQIAEILSKTYQPVLLRLDSVDLNELESENSIDKDYLISLWQKFYDTGNVEKALTNWRLRKPVPWNRIELLEH